MSSKTFQKYRESLRAVNQLFHEVFIYVRLCDPSREPLGAPLASLRNTKTRHLQFAAFSGNTMPQTNIELVKDHLEVKAIYANPSRIVVREC